MEHRTRSRTQNTEHGTQNTHRSVFRIPYSGFSLLELLIVLAIIAILAAMGSGFYRGYVKNVESQSTVRTIIAEMKHTRSKAMIGEDGYKWGVHFVNGTSDYYELFSTATNYAAGTVFATTTLSNGITFSRPTEGNSIDVIFNKISGTTTAETVIVVSEGGTQTITVSSIGTIY
ncbi:MAG: General secretion pathway protein H [Parcubacteria group bacterium GW2011_GWA1_47_8]|nr:MAG: General secretion pathway protein H [Parcubacteria group bacterium GW2011_GWA1_47_8]